MTLLAKGMLTPNAPVLPVRQQPQVQPLPAFPIPQQPLPAGSGGGLACA